VKSSKNKLKIKSLNKKYDRRSGEASTLFFAARSAISQIDEHKQGEIIYFQQIFCVQYQL
jgi:hypothetical protein